eukprot:116292-Pleurochrysis_carterae.AAC.2
MMHCQISLSDFNIGAEHEGLVLGLELEMIEALLLELGLVARRTRAAVVAAELNEANAVDAVAWPAGLESRWANGLATLDSQNFRHSASV